MRNFRVCRYVAGIVDHMGQKNELCKWSLNSRFNATDEVYRNAMGKTYGTIRQTISAFDDIFWRTIRGYESLIEADPEYSEALRDVCKSGFKFTNFSDSVLFYAPAPVDAPLRSVIAISAILQAAAAIMCYALYAQYPLRGAIVLENGSMLPSLMNGRIIDEESDLYGPVVMEAYKWESERADWMRLVASDMFMDFLQSNSESESLASKAVFGNICKVLLTYTHTAEDYACVDYLAYAKVRLAGKFDEIIQQGGNFARNGASDNLLSEKCRSKYRELLNYIISRQP